jgi:hypothetical protein
MQLARTREGAWTHQRDARTVTTPSWTLTTLVSATAALGVVLVVHGFVPGLVTNAPWDYLLEGDMRCLGHMGASAFTSWCNAFGQPQGYPFLSSGPIVYLGWAVMKTTGMNSYGAYLLAGAAFDAIALAGAYGLLRMLGVRPLTALIAGVAYLISPTVVGMNAFGGTFSGVALLPAYALVDLVVMRVFQLGRTNAIAGAVIAYSAAKTFALFMDGYSFVFWSLISAALWLTCIADKDLTRHRRVWALASVLGAHIVAVGSYSLYAPKVSMTSSLEVFRSMGLDVTTLFLPSHYVWGADLFGLATDHTDLWGDGSNATYNYLGIVCVGLAVFAAVTTWRRKHVVPFIAAGAIALILSLGPSLKVSDVRGPASRTPTVQSYLMPADAATADLPWARGYHAPALEQMRATYRWSAVTRLVLILLAALAVDQLRWRRSRFVASAVAVAALLELTPNVPRLLSEYRDHHRSRSAMTTAVVADLDAATMDGEVAFFISSDGTYNDYLANYLVPSAHLVALNAGGDKNSALASTSWPPSIDKLAQPGASRDRVAEALRSKAVDVAILPYFHLRWAAYEWPPTETSRVAALRRFAPILSDRRFETRRYRWFATVRLSR